MDNSHLDSYDYTETSKLSCAGCWLFFMACNEVRPEGTERVGFLVRGTDSKTCIPWVVPLINGGWLRDEIERRFCGHLRDRRIELVKGAVYRKCTDSLGGSSSASHGFVDDTPGKWSRFSG